MTQPLYYVKGYDSEDKTTGPEFETTESEFETTEESTTEESTTDEYQPTEPPTTETKCNKIDTICCIISVIICIIFSILYIISVVCILMIYPNGNNYINCSGKCTNCPTGSFTKFACGYEGTHKGAVSWCGSKLKELCSGADCGGNSGVNCT